MYAERFGVSDAAKERNVEVIGNVIDTSTSIPVPSWRAPCGMEPTVDRAPTVLEGRFEAADYGQYSYMSYGGASFAMDEKLVPADVAKLVKEKEEITGRSLRETSTTRSRSRADPFLLTEGRPHPRGGGRLATPWIPPDRPLAQGVTKRFGLVANDAIDLDLRRGEILALLGENGAGKTTDEHPLRPLRRRCGSILVAQADGALVPLPGGAPHAALEAGIGMVHQHFALAESLTVLENIVLGTRPLRPRASA